MFLHPWFQMIRIFTIMSSQPDQTSWLQSKIHMIDANSFYVTKHSNSYVSFQGRFIDRANFEKTGCISVISLSLNAGGLSK